MRAVTGTLPSPDGWRTIAAWAALHPDRRADVFEDAALAPHDFRATRTALYLGPAAFELFRRKCEQAAGRPVRAVPYSELN